MSAQPQQWQDTLPHSVVERVDQVCDRFEAAWKIVESTGQRPDIEDYLRDTPDSERSILLSELIALDIAYRRRAGESPRKEDYQDRFTAFDCSKLAMLLSAIPETVPPEQAVSATPTPSERPVAPAQTPRMTLPGYEILGELGRGGMGIVYKARQLALNRLVALKLIRSGAAAGPEELHRFRIEAKVIALLQHPNIVQIYEVGEHDGQPYLALELVEGSSLHERIKTAPLPAREAARLAGLLARAMHAVHQRGVIHRDLKPANVLLTADGTPKISDFGLAKRVDVDLGQTSSGAVVGTAQYMPPEQARGHIRQIGPLSDVYALGAVLYETLTGRPPFQAATVYDTLALVVSAEPPPPSRLQPAVPRDLETICLKCLQKEPAKRYASALALAEDLDRFLADRPILARRTPPWERAIKWIRRRPAVAALLLSIAATLALLVAVLASRVQETFQRQTKLLTQEAEARQLVAAAESAMSAEIWQEARTALKQALQEIGSEPTLAELKMRADNLLTEVESKLKEGEDYRKFRKLRDEALFHATLFTGRDLATNLDATQQAARQALHIFQVRIDSLEGPTLGRSANAPQQKEVREGCYELLLILAEAVAFAVPGQRPEQHSRQLNAALRILDRASSLGVTTQAYHLYRARYLSELGKQAAAQEERQRAEATPATTALDYFLGGNEKFRSAALEQASKDLERAVRLQPNHFWAQYFLAICYLKAYRPREARISLNACLVIRSDIVATYLLRGFAHAELQDYSSAEEDYEKALALKHDAEDEYAIYVNRGFMRIQQQRLRDGMVDLQHAISLKPRQYQAYLNLAQAYHLGQDLGKAIEQINQAIQLAPALDALYRIRAQLHMALNDPEGALGDLEKAIHVGRSQKTLTVLAVSTGSLLATPIEQGPFLAVSSLIPGLANHLAEDHFERGRILQLGKRHAEAVSAYEEVLRIRPEYAEAYRLRGKALLELHHYKEAIASFDQYLARAVPDVPTYRARAWAKTRLGQHASAIEDYTLALSLKPDSDMYTYRGSLHLLCHAPELAQSDFETALRLHPQNAEAINGLGYSRVAQGKCSEGTRDADKAVQLSPNSARLLYNAARTFAQAVGRMDSDAARRNRRDLEIRDRYQARALQLIRQSLHLRPITQRLEFWRNIVRTDPALNPIRSSYEWALLEAAYSKAAR
jgi:serine/threonine protein kinase/Flp pilus assembly protein TadD